MLPAIKPYRPNPVTYNASVAAAGRQSDGVNEVNRPGIAAADHPSASFGPRVSRRREPPPPMSKTPDPGRNLAARAAQVAATNAMASRLHQPQRASGRGYDDLLDTFHRVVDHTAKQAAADGSSPQSAFGRVAKHLDAYKHDTLGETVAGTCAQIHEHFSAGDDHRPSASSSSSAAVVVATRAFAQGTLLVVDQLLSALDEREPALEGTITRTRAHLHRLIFADTAATTAPDEAALARAPAACFKPNGLPKLMRLNGGPAPGPKACIDPHVLEELNSVYHGRRTYAEASALLVEKMQTIKKEADAAVGRLHSVRIAGRAIARERYQRSLQRAFVGWRGIVALGKAYRRFDSEAADQRGRIQKVETALTRISAKREFEHHSSAQHLTLMRDELRLMRHQYDAFRLITDRSKNENDDLRRQVHDLQRGAVLRLQQQITGLEHDLDQWRSRSASFAHDTAINPWELYNRWRLQGVAFPNASGAAKGAAAMPSHRTPKHGSRGGGGIGTCIDGVAHPPIGGCDAFKVVAIAEALANPFVGLTGQTSGSPTSKKAGAAGAPRSKACFHAITSFVVYDLLTLVYAISPGHITLADIRKLVVNRDEPAAAKKLASLLSELGVSCFGIAAASLSSSTKPLLELVVASIVARFAGCAPTCALKPPGESELSTWTELVQGFTSTPFAGTAGGSTAPPSISPGLTLAVSPIGQLSIDTSGAAGGNRDDLFSPVATSASFRPPGLSVTTLAGASASSASFAGGPLSPPSTTHNSHQQQQRRGSSSTSTTIPMPHHHSVAEFLQWSKENAVATARWRSLGSACLGESVKMAMEAAETPPDPPLTAAQAAQVRELRMLRVRRLREYPLHLSVEEIESLHNEVLSEPNARALRRVFVFYATGGGGRADFDARMSLDEFQRFLDDSRLLEPVDLDGGGLKQELAAALFKESIDVTAVPQKATPASSKAGAKKMSMSIPASGAAHEDAAAGEALQMTPPDFIEWIVRAADTRRRIAMKGDTVAFDKASAPDASLALDLPSITADDARTDGDFADPEHGLKVTMTSLIEDFILRNCSGGSSAEGVGRMMRSPPVADFLAKSQPTLRKIFRVYAAADSTDPDPDLSAKEFLKLCSDAGLITAADAAAAAAAEGGPAGSLFGGGGRAGNGKKAAAAPTAGPASLVSADALHQAYYRVLELMQHDGSPTGSAAGGIRLASFRELICAVSLIVTPSPFTAFHHKLRALVDGYLRPVAAGLAEKKGGRK